MLLLVGSLSIAASLTGLLAAGWLVDQIAGVSAARWARHVVEMRNKTPDF